MDHGHVITKINYSVILFIFVLECHKLNSVIAEDVQKERAATMSDA